MNLQEMGRKASEVKLILQKLTESEKNQALLKAADRLAERKKEILTANEKDMEAAREHNMKQGLQDRLRLSEDRIEAMAEGLRQIAALPDYIGEVMEELERPNGMKIAKVRVPVGVIGIIYEARPNVTADAFG